MIAYFDTSFLVLFYTNQSINSGDIVDVFESVPTKIIGDFGIHEIKNALRLCCFRKQITAVQMITSLAFVDEDFRRVFIRSIVHIRMYATSLS